MEIKVRERMLCFRLRNPVRKKHFQFGSSVACYDNRVPSHQNAIDLIPGWYAMFPEELGLRAGHLPVFNDKRITWAIECYGDVAGRAVLELGPLEGGHTTMLSKAEARVDAIEANQLAYIKCLITKEIMVIENARLLLGDFILWLEQRWRRYDLTVASGVLYHMRQPLRLVKAMSEQANSIYLWTVFVNDRNARPSEVVRFNDVDARLYRHVYGGRDNDFCGGPVDHVNWMHRDDILAVLQSLGHTNLSIAHEESVGPKLPPSFSVFARRPGLP